MASKLLARLKGQEAKLMTSPAIRRSSTNFTANSSREDRRLQMDQDNMFQMWEDLDSWRQTPKCSTPIRGYRRHRSVVEDVGKRRTSLSSNRSGSSKSSLLSFKKTIRDKSRHRHVTLSDQDSAVVCDLNSRLMDKEGSECDLRRPRSAVRHGTLNRVSRQDSDIRAKRRPINALCDEVCLSDVFPWHRSRSSSKQLRDVTNVRDTSVERKCGRGVSVDECMTDFLSNVDMENLVDFLNFYDKITSDRSRAGLDLISDECNIYDRYV